MNVLSSLYEIKPDQLSLEPPPIPIPLPPIFSTHEILSLLIGLKYLLDSTTQEPWLLMRRLLLTWTGLRLRHIRICSTVSGFLLRNLLRFGSIRDYRHTKQLSSLLIQYAYANPSDLFITFLNFPSDSSISKLSRSILLTFLLLSPHYH